MRRQSPLWDQDLLLYRNGPPKLISSHKCRELVIKVIGRGQSSRILSFSEIGST